MEGPATLLRKLDSWRRNGERLPLTAKESRRLLKANCKITPRWCWVWKLITFVSGYGRLPNKLHRAIGFGTGRVHVVAYRSWSGEVPHGKYVCHSCDVKRCFNPAHLWLWTNKDNQLDAVKKGVFKRWWTKARRKAWGARLVGDGNPMYGRRGTAAPAYGRVGKLHPMFGKHHTETAKLKIAKSLRECYRNGGR
jgi:hypothetical protein